jgi:hypothetical protein
VRPNSIEGPAIATKEQARRWLSVNGAHVTTHSWIDLVWTWGEAVGIRPDLMLAQEMFETGWGYFKGIVTPEHHNVAGKRLAVQVTLIYAKTMSGSILGARVLGHMRIIWRPIAAERLF